MCLIHWTIISLFIAGESDDTEATIVKSPDDPRSPDDPGSSGSGTTFYGSGTITPPVTPSVLHQQQKQFLQQQDAAFTRAKSAHGANDVDDIFGSAPFLSGLGGGVGGGSNKSATKAEKADATWFNNNNNTIQQPAFVAQSSVSLNTETDIFGAAPFEKKKLKRHKKLQQVAATQKHLMGGGGGVGSGKSLLHSKSGSIGSPSHTPVSSGLVNAATVVRSAAPPTSLVPSTESGDIYTTTDEIFQGVPFKLKGSKQNRAAKAAAAYAAATGEPVNNRLFSATSAEGTTPLLSPELSLTTTTTTTMSTVSNPASVQSAITTASVSLSNDAIAVAPPSPPVSEFKHHKEQSAFKVVKPRKPIVPVPGPIDDRKSVGQLPLVDIHSGDHPPKSVISVNDTKLVKPVAHYHAPAPLDSSEVGASFPPHFNPPKILQNESSQDGFQRTSQSIVQLPATPLSLPKPIHSQPPPQTQAPSLSHPPKPNPQASPQPATFKTSYESIESCVKPESSKPLLAAKSPSASCTSLPQSASRGSTDNLPAPFLTSSSTKSIGEGSVNIPTANIPPLPKHISQEAVLTRTDRAQSLNLPPDAPAVSPVDVSFGESKTESTKCLSSTKSLSQPSAAVVASSAATMSPAAASTSAISALSSNLRSRRASSDVTAEKPPIAKKPSVGVASVSSGAVTSVSIASKKTTGSSSAEFKPDISTDHFLASTQHGKGSNNNSTNRNTSTSSNGSQQTPPSPKIHPSSVMPSTPKVTPVDGNSASASVVTPKHSLFGEKIKSKSTSKKEKARAAEKQMSAFTNKSFEDIYSDPEEEQQPQQRPTTASGKDLPSAFSSSSSSSSARRSLSLTSAFANAGGGAVEQQQKQQQQKQQQRQSVAEQEFPSNSVTGVKDAPPSLPSAVEGSATATAKSKKSDKKKISGSSSVDSIADSLKKRFSLSSKS